MQVVKAVHEAIQANVFEIYVQSTSGPINLLAQLDAHVPTVEESFSAPTPGTTQQFYSGVKKLPAALMGEETVRKPGPASAPHEAEPLPSLGHRTPLPALLETKSTPTRAAGTPLECFLDKLAHERKQKLAARCSTHATAGPRATPSLHRPRNTGHGGSAFTPLQPYTGILSLSDPPPQTVSPGVRPARLAVLFDDAAQPSSPPHPQRSPSLALPLNAPDTAVVPQPDDSEDFSPICVPLPVTKVPDTNHVRPEDDCSEDFSPSPGPRAPPPVTEPPVVKRRRSTSSSWSDSDDEDLGPPTQGPAHRVLSSVCSSMELMRLGPGQQVDTIDLLDESDGDESDGDESDGDESDEPTPQVCCYLLSLFFYF